MKKDPYKLRAVALLIAVGFVGGMFLQYQAPGAFGVASHQAKKKKKGGAAGNGDAFIGAEESEGDAAKDSPPPPEPEAAQKPRDDEAAKKAEAPKPLPPEEVTPATLRGAAAMETVIDNTLEINGPDGEKRTLYFASRGVVVESGGDDLDARLWSRDDDRLCRSLAGGKRECFYVAVRLNEQLQKGEFKELPERIAALKEGETIGSVEGLGAQKAQLLRGNLLGVPGYVPLLEGKPSAEWTQGAGGFVGALLVRQRRDGDRAVTFFAPNGTVLEASRVGRHAVNLWIGAWRRQGDLVCRQLKSETQESSRAEHCARPRITDGRVEFVDAAPSWRSYVRSPWPDDEQASPAASDPPSSTGEVVLGARGRKNGGNSFTDLR